MEERQQLPDANRLSVLASTILLAYAISPFIRLPATELTLNLPGAIFSFGFQCRHTGIVLVAALAAVWVPIGCCAVILAWEVRAPFNTGCCLR
jgi:hypothetical protein